jgi:hypothetical protein
MLAGCGSTGLLTSSSSSSGGTPLTVAAWKQRINGICMAMTARSQATPRPHTSAEVVPFVRRIVAAGHAEIEQLKSVAAPPGYAAEQRRMVADLTAIFGALDALAAKQPTAAQFATALRTRAFLRAAADYVARSRAAGLSSCVLAPGT